MHKDLNKINHTAGQESRSREKQWWCHTTYSNQHLHLQQWKEREKKIMRERITLKRKHSGS